MPYAIKVSEYPFQQNENIFVKNMTLQLCTYLYNIFLNVLRPIFFKYVIYPFHALQISVKLRSKLGQKLATFPTLWAPAPTELQLSILFSPICSQPREQWNPISFFSNIFRIIYFLLFSCKMRLPNLPSYYYKKWITHY